jgi:DNA repair exonuclease SbcCD ATPase subunit
MELGERRMNELQERFRALDTQMERVIREGERAEARGAVLDQLKQQVGAITSACERARGDAAQVLDSRAQLDETRQRLEQLLGQTATLTQRFEGLERRGRSLDHLEQRLDALRGVLQAIDGNLENFRQEKALIDHASEKLARLEFTMKQAEVVTRELAEQRDLSDRIHQGIQSLRGAARAAGAGSEGPAAPSGQSES